MKVSDVTDAPISKIVKLKSQSHADLVLRCERRHPQRFLVSGPDDTYGRTNSGCFTNTTFLAERNITVLEKSPYSFDRTPCDVFSALSKRPVFKKCRGYQDGRKYTFPSVITST